MSQDNKKNLSTEEKYQELMAGIPTEDKDVVEMFLKKHYLASEWIEILINYFYPEFWKGCQDQLLFAAHNPKVTFHSKYMFVIICEWLKDNYKYYQPTEYPINGISHEAYRERYR